VLTGLATILAIFYLWPIVLKCLLQGSRLHFRAKLEVNMDWQFIILVGTIAFVILFILTGIIVSIVLFAVMGSANK
jgi:hypothetical protein